MTLPKKPVMTLLPTLPRSNTYVAALQGLICRRPDKEHCMDAVSGTLRGERPQIVVVEDDSAVRRSLQLLLQGGDFDVRAYGTPASFLADANGPSPDCLITDYRMDGMDGIAVLDQLRDRGWSGPAVLMTAFNSADIERAAREKGFAVVLEKPFRDRSMVKIVKDLIGTSREH